MQKISTFLWFMNNRAEEAANFYTGIFKDSKILKVVPYGDAGPGPKGEAMLVSFELNGQEFYALNGNPQFEFNHSVSLFVPCKDQAEIDHFWSALTAGGEEVACGWLKDKFGLSWQIVPENIGELIATPAGMKAMMGMKKLDIAALKAASTS
jgi:predicted 3-demethylubiquinone-9 3-methyltransferase (glyoxalase superfamily)